MNVAETLLVFVGAPLAVVVVLALLIFVPGGRKRTRYKSGQPWTHAPVWYEPHPEHGPAAGHGCGETLAIGSSVFGERHGVAAEQTHGSTAVGDHGSATAAPPAVSAGPLGGARGTW
ncbi:MAG: hypothetical protein JWP33_2689 [Blastococcus sp.]|nr:hypothetical protein [Blastococcus sp.]